MTVSSGNVKYFELGAGTDAFRVSSTQERPVLPGGSARLHQQNFFNDLFDIRLFLDEAAIGVATSYTEPSGYEQHWHCLPTLSQFGDKFDCRNAGQKAVSGSLGGNEA